MGVPSEADMTATTTALRHPIIRRKASAYDFSGLLRAVGSAQNKGLKRISMRFDRFIVKPSKYAGKLYIFSHDKEVNQWGSMSNVYIGWITEKDTSVGEVSLIDDIQNASADPYGSAKLYGQHTGTCSCCGRELTNKLSIELGIGPICREKFGL
jgi:hypothetical protein